MRLPIARFIEIFNRSWGIGCWILELVFLRANVAPGPKNPLVFDNRALEQPWRRWRRMLVSGVLDLQGLCPTVSNPNPPKVFAGRYQWQIWEVLKIFGFLIYDLIYFIIWSDFLFIYDWILLYNFTEIAFIYDLIYLIICPKFPFIYDLVYLIICPKFPFICWFTW